MPVWVLPVWVTETRSGENGSVYPLNLHHRCCLPFYSAALNDSSDFPWHTPPQWKILFTKQLCTVHFNILLCVYMRVRLCTHVLPCGSWPYMYVVLLDEQWCQRVIMKEEVRLVDQCHMGGLFTWNEHFPAHVKWSLVTDKPTHTFRWRSQY